MASRRASAPCRSGTCVRVGPEKRLQNTCREFWSTLLTCVESCGLGGRELLARSKRADYCGGGTPHLQHRPPQEGHAHRKISKLPLLNTRLTPAHPHRPANLRQISAGSKGVPAEGD